MPSAKPPKSFHTQDSPSLPSQACVLKMCWTDGYRISTAAIRSVCRLLRWENSTHVACALLRVQRETRSHRHPAGGPEVSVSLPCSQHPVRVRPHRDGSLPPRLGNILTGVNLHAPPLTACPLGPSCHPFPLPVPTALSCAKKAWRLPLGCQRAPTCWLHPPEPHPGRACMEPLSGPHRVWGLDLATGIGGFVGGFVLFCFVFQKPGTAQDPEFWSVSFASSGARHFYLPLSLGTLRGPRITWQKLSRC